MRILFSFSCLAMVALAAVDTFLQVEDSNAEKQLLGQSMPAAITIPEQFSLKYIKAVPKKQGKTLERQPGLYEWLVDKKASRYLVKSTGTSWDTCFYYDPTTFVHKQAKGPKCQTGSSNPDHLEALTSWFKLSYKGIQKYPFSPYSYHTLIKPDNVNGSPETLLFNTQGNKLEYIIGAGINSLVSIVTEFQSV